MKKLFYDMPHHLFNSFFECSDTEMNWHPSTFTLSPPSIKLPFPPPITAQDIVLKRPTSKICSKSPNAFFCYRKAYFDQLSLLNQRFKMTDVSKLVSINWKNERREVKEAYKKLAQEVEWELNERRKRDLVYPEINSNNKMNRRRSNIQQKKKCGKVITNTSSVEGGTQFELAFNSEMQPLINGNLENYLMPNYDNFFSSSDEPAFVTETNDDENLFDSETLLDQNDVRDQEEEGDDDDDDDDNGFDPIPAQSQNNQKSLVEKRNDDNLDNHDLLNVQNVAFDEFCFDEFCFDDNTNLSWYLQNFV